MKGIQNNKAHKTDKQIPGCLGRMVNLFDLSAGVSANRLLMDKPHRDGSLLKSRSDVARMLGAPAGNKLEDKMVYPDLRSLPVKKSHSTPMRMLIEDEMSKEIKSRHGPPNVVAKLMGLDALPQQQHDILSHSRDPARYWHEEHDCLNRRMKWKAHEYDDHGDYRDVYEMQKKYQRKNYMREKDSKKKMELVRQKFVEAKRLAANEKLCQSKEFQDAVEVLSCNKELFLEFLEEPNALISEHLYELQSICTPPETKRITVLRPSKMIDLEKFPTRAKKNEYPIKRPAQVVRETYFSYDAGEYANEPTQIVVLKPNAGKMCEIKSSVSVYGGNTSEIEGNHRRDEALISRPFGVKDSFDKSKNQYPLEGYDDFEAMSPRHSWDCVNGFGSPFSSSFSRTSSSPDLLVSREAKKRLSERWAMMATGGGSRHGRRSSNTLGEMLALADSKKSVINNKASADKGVAINMPVTLQRSKSLPSSSIEHGNSLKEPKPAKRSSTSSFKGKVSSFFFPRNKKSSKDKCLPTRPADECQSAASDTPESSVSAYNHNKVTYYVNQFAEDSQLEEGSSPGASFCSRSFPVLSEIGQNQCTAPEEVSNQKPAMKGNLIENPDQPSPISVLELQYEEDDTATPESSGNQRPTHRLMSNLINKSPPIESIARTLTWDDSCSGSASPNPSHPTSYELLEQEWLLLINKILSAAGLDKKTQWDIVPLDPSLRDNFSISDNDEEPMREEAKRSQQRSNLKLVFDCVNEAIVQIMGQTIEHTGFGLQRGMLLSGKPPLTVLDRVWGIVREWVNCEVVRDDLDCHIMAVEIAVGGGRPGESFGLAVGDFRKEIEGELMQELVEEAIIDLL